MLDKTEDEVEEKKPDDGKKVIPIVLPKELTGRDQSSLRTSHSESCI